MIPFLSLGLDLSASQTGLVLLEAMLKGPPKLIIEENIVIKNKVGFFRYREIARRIVQVVQQHTPDRIVIEGYSLSMAHSSSIIPLVELGGLVRFLFNLDGIHWLDPSASEVKKFVSGKGNTKKTLIPMFVLKRWGHTSKSDDTADAYTCAAMGLAHANRLDGVTIDMRAIVGKLEIKAA